MSRLNRLSLIALFLCFSCAVFAQYNVGIRAGTGQGKFRGPTEQFEEFGYSGGFHFGINFQWNFSDVIGLRSEILYNQVGSSYQLNSPEGYYIFDPENDNLANITIRDSSVINLKHSNAYLQLPQTVHFKLGKKVELFAGGYVGFLINPVATGTQTFGGFSRDKEHSFQQGLSFNYFGDDQFTFQEFFGVSNILIRANGQDVTITGVANSFSYQGFGITEEQFENGAVGVKDGRFLSIDYGLIFGGAYYLNRGLYVMGRVEYGMRDITRNVADYSFANVNQDQTPIFNNDSDKNFGIYLSVGFKF